MMQSICIASLPNLHTSFYPYCVSIAFPHTFSHVPSIWRLWAKWDPARTILSVKDESAVNNDVIQNLRQLFGHRTRFQLFYISDMSPFINESFSTAQLRGRYYISESCLTLGARNLPYMWTPSIWQQDPRKLCLLWNLSFTVLNRKRKTKSKGRMSDQPMRG